MKAYTVIQGRPIGRNPYIYLYDPSINFGDIDDNPWFPEVETWESVSDAFNAVWEYCDDDDYRTAIKIIIAPSKDNPTYE